MIVLPIIQAYKADIKQLFFIKRQPMYYEIFKYLIYTLYLILGKEDIFLEQHLV